MPVVDNKVFLERLSDLYANAPRESVFVSMKRAPVPAGKASQAAKPDGSESTERAGACLFRAVLEPAAAQQDQQNKRKRKIKISTLVPASQLAEFSSSYASVMKVGMTALKKKERQKRKKKKAASVAV